MATSKKAKTVDENLHLNLMTELYRSFDFFNEKYAKGKLNKPVIQIATAGTRKAMGWFCHDIWSQDGKTKHEINICGEALAAGIEQTFDTLLHEMAHLQNFDAGIKDCTDQQRHNDHFKKAAEGFGLSVKSSKRFGSAHTSLTDATKAVIYDELKPNTELFKLYRKAFNEIKKKKEKKPRDLKPVLLDKETKETTVAGAEKLGCEQKNLVDIAVKYYMHILATKPKSIPKQFQTTSKPKKA
jgi:hypothetical protein